MRIVAARDWVSGAPRDLDALLICERAASGDLKRLCVAGDIGPPGSHFSEETFREVAPVLLAADLSFANLENPIVEDFDQEMLFAAPANAAPFLAEAGFRLLNLANNHILGYGTAALADTRGALAAAGLGVLGAGPDPAAARQLVVTDLGGLRLGWLGCARTLQPQEPEGEGFWEYDPGELSAAIHRARERVDVLAVSIHMGYMYLDYPHPDQRREALAFVEAGADLVLMHHAHVLQGIEVVPGGLVCYNLGNFLFDWTVGGIVVEKMREEQRTGAVFVFDLDRRGVCRAAALPIRVDDGWIVRWASGESGRAILARLQQISDGWGTAAATRFHRQMADRLTGHTARTAYRELRRGGLAVIPELVRRIRGHHLRMVAGWPVQKLKRWLKTAPPK